MVLSAAHCFIHSNVIEPADSIKMIAGSTREGSFDQKGSQTRNVTNLILHENHDDKTKDNDIALLIPDIPFEYTKYVRPACLPGSPLFKMAARTDCIISGFGTIKDRIFAEYLQQAVIPMNSTDECYQDLPRRITEHQICGGGNGVDTCQGDSGGPLICRVGNQGYTLVGITSWGYGCGKTPGVYTEVADYLDWIKENERNL